MMDLILGAWPQIVTALAVLGAALGLYLKGGRDAIRKRDAAAVKDTLYRTDAGRAAAQKAQQDARKGLTPAQIKERNDAGW